MIKWHYTYSDNKKYLGGVFMSTRSAIGIQRKDGTIEAIYCHWDGYPSGNGEILLNHYKDVKKINKLLKLGDLSQLGENPQSKKEFWEDSTKLGNNCLAYNDRGEKTHSQVFKTYKEFKSIYKGCWCEYIYLFDVKTHKWQVQDVYKRKPTSIEEAIQKESN